MSSHCELINYLLDLFLLFSALNDKNKYLKKNLHHERQSRESLQSEINEAQEFGKDKFRESWQNMSELHSLIQEKEIIIQNLKFNQAKEVEDLKWKLNQRDQTLKKVLESKITASSTNEIAHKSLSHRYNDR